MGESMMHTWRLCGATAIWAVVRTLVVAAVAATLAGCGGSSGGGGGGGRGDAAVTGDADVPRDAGLPNDLVCGDGTWDHDGDGQTECRPWTACVAGEYVVAAGGKTFDQECAACAEGTFSGTKNADQCEPWSLCVAGEYVAADGTAIADRTCVECGDGTFSTTANAAECAPWTNCVAGERVLVAGTATANRTCEMCAVGYYTAAANSSACAAVGTCAAGTRQTAAGTGTSPVACETCAAGNYCAGGTAAAVPCTTGTWDDDGSAASMCASWATCDPGEYVLTDGSPTANRACAACDDEYFSETTNAETCEPWTTCESWEYVEFEGSSTEDRVCGASCTIESPTTQARVLVTDTADLFPSTFTYELWVWFDSFQDTSPGQYFLQAVAVDYQLLYMRLFGGNLQCVIGTGSGEIVVQYPLAGLNEDAWGHIACTRDATELALWIDGDLVDTASGSPYAPPPPGTPLSFGGDSRTPPNSPQFVGGIDDVRISDVVRYTSDFTPEFRHTADADTLALFHFDECTGSTTADALDETRTGSLDYGATWVAE